MASVVIQAISTHDIDTEGVPMESVGEYTPSGAESS